MIILGEFSEVNSLYTEFSDFQPFPTRFSVMFQ